MNELALFAGAGGGILGGKLLGWRTVCAVEINPYAASLLVARQNDKILPPFPIWDDVSTFDGKPWRGIVDVVSGGFPCQDISVAGKGAGITGTRSGLWKEMARIIGEVRPKFAYLENSPMLIKRGLTTVLSDLAEMGYDARWSIMAASDVGAPHKRKRIWILGYTNNNGFALSEMFRSINARSDSSKTESVKACKSEGSNWQQSFVADTISNSKAGLSSRKKTRLAIIGCSSKYSCSNRWWEAEPEVGRVADGVAARMDRLKALGNGQVAEVARRAWDRLIND